VNGDQSRDTIFIRNDLGLWWYTLNVLMQLRAVDHTLGWQPGARGRSLPSGWLGLTFTATASSNGFCHKIVVCSHWFNQRFA
jgi:hypothetical protein